MVRRVRSDDLELMATAISIQHQVGGNLAEILDSIAFTIRERVRIKGEIRTLTAQQRLSGYVVGVPADRPGRLPVHRRARLHGADVRQPAGDPRPAGRRGHPHLRRVHDVHRASCSSAGSSTSRSSRCPSLPIVVAGLAAGAHPAHRHRARRQLAGRPGPGPPDPARVDAGQEPRGARAPAAVHRADAAPARGAPVGQRRARHQRVVQRTDREAPRPGRQPRRPARRRLARHQGHRRDRRRRSCSSSCSASSASSGFPFVIGGS